MQWLLFNNIHNDWYQIRSIVIRQGTNTNIGHYKIWCKNLVGLTLWTQPYCCHSNRRTSFQVSNLRHICHLGHIFLMYNFFTFDCWETISFLIKHFHSNSHQHFENWRANTGDFMLRLVKRLDCQIFFLTSKLSKYSINRRLVGQSLVHLHSIAPSKNSWTTWLS